MKKLVILAVVATVLLAATGCAVNRATASVTPGVDLADAKYFYIEKLAADKHGVNEIIASQLNAMGHEASTGSAGQAPDEADTIVTYLDRWMWDITMYMLELTIKMEDAKTGFTLANGNSFHTSMTRKAPEEMVKEVLVNIFGGGTQAGEE